MALDPSLNHQNSQANTSARLPAATQGSAVMSNSAQSSFLARAATNVQPHKRNFSQMVEAGIINAGAITSNTAIGSALNVATGASMVLKSDRLAKLVLPAVSKLLRSVVPLPL